MRWSPSGELSAPIVIGRDHLDSGSVASPNRETEAMLDGSDAVSDWPLLNALLNTASGATWVSHPSWRRRRHGLLAACRRGHRVRRHARRAARRIARAVERSRHRRHAARGCGLPEAVDCAREQGLDLPMVDTRPSRERARSRCAPASFDAAAAAADLRSSRRRCVSARATAQRIAAAARAGGWIVARAMPPTASTPASACSRRPASRAISSR